jgi:hypothetical protein
VTPTWATRTFQAGTGISITNPAGIAGDPTIACTLPQIAQRVYKSTDTSRNSTITPAADPHLTLSLDNGTWAFRCVAYAYGDANADWRVAMNTSNANAVLQWGWNLGNVFDCLLRGHAGLNCSLSGTGVAYPANTRIMQFDGKVEVTSGPHNLYLDWAQFTNTGNNVTVKAGSFLEVWQVS